MNSAQNSFCKLCGEPATAVLDYRSVPYCGQCGSEDGLLDITDASKFVPDFGEVG